MESLSADLIRVLDLHPGTGDDPVRCDIRTVRLADGPAYETLSYVWGPAGDCAAIEVNGRPASVTTSLLVALRRLRPNPDPEDGRAAAPRTLWIDQLCIDQENLAEKAAQVRLMRHIYSDCARVVVWLGPVPEGVPLDDARAAVGFFEYLAAAARTEEGWDRAGLTRPHWFGARDATMAVARALRAFGVHECAWWQRIWTVQEAVLPGDAVFMWGPLELSWDLLSDARRTWITNIQSGVPYEVCQAVIGPGCLGHFMAHFTWLLTTDQGDHWPLATVVQWRSRKATDLRDKAYALTGLYPAGTIPRSERCDYTLGTAEVYAALTLDLIDSEDGSLAALTVNPRADEPAIPGLPRWAFDMTDEPERRIDSWFQIWGYPHYHANGGLPPTPLTRTGAAALELGGVGVDVVRTVGEARIAVGLDFDPAVPPPLLQRWWQLYERDWAARLLSSSASISPSDRHYGLRPLDAFCRMLVGDLVRNRELQVDHEVTADELAEVLRYVEGAVPHDDDHLVHMTLGHATRNRRFFVTEKGRMGLGHWDTQPGEEIWVLNRGGMPFTLRKRAGEEGEYDFMAHCFVEGIMQGEEFHGQENPAQQTIRIF
ncbi:HET-domain-containing protein [Xylariaceae sp. FL0804]|nr:HET-domain-containing protein [Xylariaceae sp. FL0804]